MIEARTFIDQAVGERRRALVDEEDRVFRLEVERASEAGTWPRAGEKWRVRLVEPAIDGGWRVDLGGCGEGILRGGQDKQWSNGRQLVGCVVAEPWRDKGAVLKLAEDAVASGTQLGRVAAAEEDQFVRGIAVTETICGPDARTVLDAAMETALAVECALPGGGRIWVEPIRAGTVIDVDRGSARGEAHEINLAAAKEAALQVSLKGLAGLIFIDFIGSPGRARSDELARSFLGEAKRLGVKAIDSLGLSRFGVLQVARSRERRDLRSALVCPADEREALDALRYLETLGVSERGAQLELELSSRAAAWLETSYPAWEAEMADRIGHRWRLVVADRGDAKPVARIRRK